MNSEKNESSELSSGSQIRCSDWLDNVAFKYTSCDNGNGTSQFELCLTKPNQKQLFSGTIQTHPHPSDVSKILRLLDKFV